MRTEDGRSSTGMIVVLAVYRGGARGQGKLGILYKVYTI